jgi:hypothetical protein
MNVQQMESHWLRSASRLTAIFAVFAVHGMSAHARLQSVAPQGKVESKASTDQSALYCNWKALSAAERERLHQLVEKLKAARTQIKELPDGYAFRLQTERVSIGEVAEYVASERKCCPFFDFEIEAQRDGGPLWLRLSGKVGVKEFIRRELEIR